LPWLRHIIYFVLQQVTKSTFVCSAHFMNEDYITKAYTKRQVLKPTAKPSVFAEKSQKAPRKVPNPDPIASTVNSSVALSLVECQSSASCVDLHSTASESPITAQCSTGTVWHSTIYFCLTLPVLFLLFLKDFTVCTLLMD